MPRFLLLLCLSVNLFGQAVYPGAIADRVRIPVAADKKGTAALSVAVNASTTSWVLQPGQAVAAGLRVNAILYCEEEKVRVTAINGDTLTVVRGVHGTTPASHLDGLSVVARYGEEHINPLAEETIAIQNALGVQLGNVTKRVTGTGAPSNPCETAGMLHTDTSAGDQYFCQSNGGSWKKHGSGTGVGSLAPQVTYSSNVATFGGNCGTGASTCWSAWGNQYWPITSSSTFTVPGGTGSTLSTVYFYVDATGAVKARYDSSLIVNPTFAGGMSGDTTATSAPLGVDLRASCSVQSGNFTGCTNYGLKTTYAATGTGGIVVTPTAGGVQIDGSGISGTGSGNQYRYFPAVSCNGPTNTAVLLQPYYSGAVGVTSATCGSWNPVGRGALLFSNAQTSGVDPTIYLYTSVPAGATKLDLTIDAMIRYTSPSSAAEFEISIACVGAGTPDHVPGDSTGDDPVFSDMQAITVQMAASSDRPVSAYTIANKTLPACAAPMQAILIRISRDVSIAANSTTNAQLFGTHLLWKP